MTMIMSGCSCRTIVRFIHVKLLLKVIY